MRLYKNLLVSLMFCSGLLSCENFPQDTYETTKEIKGGTMMVGYTEHWPWVFRTEEGEVQGIEVAILKQFAQTMKTEIRWIRKNQEVLLQDLEHHNIHLVTAGLTDKTPWKKRVTPTRPYLKYENQNHILAVPPGEHRFLYELEVFLHRQKPAIKKLMQEYVDADPPDHFEF